MSACWQTPTAIPAIGEKKQLKEGASVADTKKFCSLVCPSIENITHSVKSTDVASAVHTGARTSLHRLLWISVTTCFGCE